jgi:hypothetical protein
MCCQKLLIERATPVFAPHTQRALYVRRVRFALCVGVLFDPVGLYLWSYGASRGLSWQLFRHCRLICRFLSEMIVGRQLVSELFGRPQLVSPSAGCSPSSIHGQVSGMKPARFDVTLCLFA